MVSFLICRKHIVAPTTAITGANIIPMKDGNNIKK
jgi:hypothetical protein